MAKPKPKILFAVDNDALAKAYLKSFKAAGFVTKRAVNGEEAIFLAWQWQPDLIITGIMIEKLSGFDTIEILKKIPATKNIRIMVCSGLALDSDIKRAKDLGADEYLIESKVTIADTINATQDLLNRD